MKYDHKKIEAKWQKKWGKEKLYKTPEDKDKPKYYILDMFPYPSGAGLHVGHPKGYIATDIFARAKMMQGYNVLHPMGWDAFGLPAENYAIANKIHPRTATEKNIKVFKGQLEKLGFTYDWDREIDTTDPEFYKWTQWVFLKMFERGLAYESYEPINWCPDCKTGLSNEDLEDGKCERCGSEIERKPMRQWVLKITDYAERMLNDLEKLPYWEESIKEMQKNWIGKSEGANVKFSISNNQKYIDVFTTRPDTLFGATFMVIAPEHPLVKKITTEEQKIEVEKYVKKATGKSDLERTELAKEKTGVFTGAYAINPVNQEKIPVYIADYVMMGYGTGAIMAVPAHDYRDWEFAKKYNIPIKQVVAPYFSIDSGVDAVCPDKKIIKRYTAYSFVKHCKKDEYLCLDWEKFGWHSGIIGGVDQGEDPIESAKREIREETGYKNIRLIKDMDMETHNNFYAAHKNENRYAFGPAFLFELINEEQESTSEEHTKNHQAVWIKGKDMATFLNLANFVYLWKVLQGQESFCFTDNGVAINSGFINNLETSVVKERIIAWLEKNKLGKRSVNYKIKDWVFSRQRYWGEPIPIVHCEKCGKKKEQVLILHGWEDSSQTGFIPSLKEDLEKKGYEIFAIDLPDTDYPVFDAWYNYAENKIKELNLKHFHIVGHSMGGHLSLKLAEKYDLASLTLVAPVGFNPSEKYYTHFKEKLSIGEIKIFKKYQSRSLDVDKVKNNVKNINFIFGGKDPWITKEIKDYYIENFQNYADIVVLDNYGHMSKSEGVKKLEPLEKLFSISSPGVVAVPKDQLPVLLPEVKNYEPTGMGESPLANIKDWVNTKCPKCGGPGKRETNTMPQWAGSSWYYLRYIDPHNNKALIDKAKDKYWSPVDFYVGGAEHATRHLIYARFWHKFLFDIGAVNYDEPFTRLQHVGLILAEDGRKMSKRWHNVINPDEIVEKYGADAMRVYEMFMGPFKEPCAWSTNGLIGARRFLDKTWDYIFADYTGIFIDDNDRNQWVKGKREGSTSHEIEVLLNKTIKKVTEDIENFRFNTAISQLMILRNSFYETGVRLPILSKSYIKPISGKCIKKSDFEKFVILLAPFAPHLAEELWAGLGHKQSIFKSDWPKFDPDLIKDETINLVIQINGKVRDIIEVSADIREKEAKKIALESEKVKKWLEGKEAKKIIFVKGKLVNIVI